MESLFPIWDTPLHPKLCSLSVRDNLHPSLFSPLIILGSDMITINGTVVIAAQRFRHLASGAGVNP